MFERFSGAARDVVVAARDEAGRAGHPVVTSGHLLVALADPGGDAAGAGGDAPGGDRPDGDRSDRDTAGGGVATADRPAAGGAGGGVAGLLAGAGATPGALRAALDRVVRGGPARPTQGDAEALRAVGVDVDAMLAALEESLGPDAFVPLPPEPPRGLFGRRRDGAFGDDAKKALELALRECLRLGGKEIRPEHLLLGVLRDSRGAGGRVLAGLGVDAPALRSAAEASLRRAA